MNPDETTPSQSVSAVGEDLSQDANRLAETAKDRARKEAETRKEQSVQAAHSASSALGKAAEEMEQEAEAPAWLSSAFRQAASGIDRIAGTLESRSTDQLAGDITRFARDNPAAFLTASAAAGFVAARFPRAGAEYKSDHQDGAQGRSSAGMGLDADDRQGIGETASGYGSSAGRQGAGYGANRDYSSTAATTDAMANSGVPSADQRGNGQ